MVTRSPRRYSRALQARRVRAGRVERQVMSPKAVTPGTGLRRPIGAISIRNRRSKPAWAPGTAACAWAGRKEVRSGENWDRISTKRGVLLIDELPGEIEGLSSSAGRATRVQLEKIRSGNKKLDDEHRWEQDYAD